MKTTKMMTTTKKGLFSKLGRRGATMVEYAILIIAVGVGALVAFQTLATKISGATSAAGAAMGQ